MPGMPLRVQQLAVLVSRQSFSQPGHTGIFRAHNYRRGIYIRKTPTFKDNFCFSGSRQNAPGITSCSVYPKGGINFFMVPFPTPLPALHSQGAMWWSNTHLTLKAGFWVNLWCNSSFLADTHFTLGQRCVPQVYFHQEVGSYALPQKVWHIQSP